MMVIFSLQSLGIVVMFHDSVEQNSEYGNLLCLYVGVSLGPQTHRKNKKYEEYSTIVLWCVDGRYEYINANILDDS